MWLENIAIFSLIYLDRGNTISGKLVGVEITVLANSRSIQRHALTDSQDSTVALVDITNGQDEYIFLN